MKRESNIELLRIVAMLLVVLLHSNYFSLGWVKPSDISADTFVRIFTEQLCIICVNVFVFISGWFGIRASLKGAISLLYQVAFFHILIVATFLCIGHDIPIRILIKGFYFGSTYWFILSYLILYAISPILNAFINHANPRLYLSVLLGYFFLEFSLGWLFSLPGASFDRGYSAISFIGLYLLAGFINRHDIFLTRLNKSYTFLLYLIFTLLPIGLLYLTKHYLGMIAYSSPFVIAASVFFFLTFKNLKINKYNSIINFIAASVFSIYLIHLHPLVAKHFINFMRNAYNLLDGSLYILFAILFALFLGFVCVLLDKLRIMTWKWFCCIFLERFLLKIENSFNKLYTYLGY